MQSFINSYRLLSNTYLSVDSTMQMECDNVRVGEWPAVGEQQLTSGSKLNIQQATAIECQ